MIELLVLLLIYIVLGALLRRWWGGWNPAGIKISPRLARLALNYIIAFLAGFALIDWRMGLITLIIGAVIAHPVGHGRAMAMGQGNPNGTLPVNVCIAIFLGNYGIAMAAVGMLWNLLYHSQAGYIYAAMGLFCWVPHWAAQYVIKPICQKIGYIGKAGDNLFIGKTDDPVPFGELGLGALLYGGLPASHAIACYFL